jgi:hypothetical protein
VFVAELKEAVADTPVTKLNIALFTEAVDKKTEAGPVIAVPLKYNPEL